MPQALTQRGCRRSSTTTCGVEVACGVARIAEIHEGANETRKWIVARTVFGKDLMG